MTAPMTVYTKTGCPWCIAAIAWLRDKGYTFEEVSVSQDSEAFARMRQISGQSSAPTLEMADGKVLADFGVDELEEFVRQHDIKP